MLLSLWRTLSNYTKKEIVNQFGTYWLEVPTEVQEYEHCGPRDDGTYKVLNKLWLSWTFEGIFG